MCQKRSWTILHNLAKIYILRMILIMLWSSGYDTCIHRTLRLNLIVVNIKKIIDLIEIAVPNARFKDYESIKSISEIVSESIFSLINRYNCEEL